MEGKIVLCEDRDEVYFARRYAKGILYKTGDFEHGNRVWYKKEEFKKIPNSFAKMGDGIVASGKHTPILAKICRSEWINNSGMLVVPDFSGRGPNLIMDILKVIYYMLSFFFFFFC